MRVQLKASLIELTPAIEEYATKRIASLDKYFSEEDPDTVMVNIELGKTTRHHKSGEVFKAEVFLRVPGKEYYASSEQEDLYAAIDDVKDDIAREITSWKERSKTLFRKGGARVKNLIKKLYWKS